MILTGGLMLGNISIIVPVYNVAAYLSDCINSILNQSYSQLEIILVDDGSTDGSGQLCDKYAQVDTRIKVIHQKNGGAASARNAGLSIASGEYLSFVDSDDFLADGAYEYMIAQMQLHQSDVIQCGFNNVYLDYSGEQITIDSFTNFSKLDYLRRFTTDWTCGLLWDKLYRRELFDGIWFEEGHKIDDEFFTYQGIMNAHCIIHSPRIVYNYRKRKSSIMLQTESQQKIVLDKIDYLQKRRLKIITNYPELRQEFDYQFLSMLVILSKDAAATEESIKITQHMLEQYFSGDTHCKIDFSLRRQLFWLQHRNIYKILQSRHDNAPINEEYRCFE